MRIEGSVKKGFEPLKALFERRMIELAERNAQLCVYVGNERVVDLWCASPGEDQFSGDSLVNVFSSGKSLEAIALASLHDHGLLDYDRKIADYWPEFSANGKQDVSVADLMRHEAGLAALRTSVPPADLRTENIKRNAVGRIIESHGQAFREGHDQQREYHAITRGWIANEVFRRIDPAGRTIGEFLREEISGPLGADVHIGVTEDELARRSPVIPLGVGFQMLEGLKPRRFGRRVEHNILQTSGRLMKLIAGMRKGTSKGAPAPIQGMQVAGGIAGFNEPAIAMGEVPSANTHANARGLARLAAFMANGGTLSGQQLLGEAGWQALHAAPVQRDMNLFNVVFTQGGVAAFGQVHDDGSEYDRGANQGREGFYGWFGLGGSIFQWHPEHKIGFGYVPTSLNIFDIVNERGKAYQAEAVRCVESL